MLKPTTFAALFAMLSAMGCSDDNAATTSMGGTSGSTSNGGTPGAAGSATSGAPAASGSSSSPFGGSSGVGGSAGANSSAGANTNAGAGGSMAGGASSGGTAGAGGAGGTTATAGAAGMLNVGGTVNTLPADYKGTPFATLVIPGRINTCDYDRGGKSVAWCHDPGGCGGTTTGDYPQASGVYRAPMPANAQVCGGAACDDNVGVCRMNPQKPDNTIAGQPMPATDTYLCYSVPGEWTKYTVHVAEAGTYSISCIMGVQVAGAGFNLSFGQNITSGDIPVTTTPTASSGSGEGFHSWDDRKNLGTVTFQAAGTYLMTFTQVSRINADSFTFTKM